MYDNTNKGVAFPNDYKKEEKHPDFKGKGNFNGQDFEFGIWKRQGEKGEFLSFSFSEPYKKPEGKNWQAAKEKFGKDTVVDVDPDEEINLDSIPFN